MLEHENTRRSPHHVLDFIRLVNPIAGMPETGTPGLVNPIPTSGGQIMLITTSVISKFFTFQHPCIGIRVEDIMTAT